MTTGRPAVALAALITCSAVATAPATADPAADCQQSADPDLAIEGCTIYLETASGEPAYLASYLRGSAYFAKHDFYHAARDFTAALNVHPSADAYLNRGISYVYLMADDPAFADMAIADMNDALAIKSDLDRKPFALAYATRAATNLAKGQDAQAAADEESAVQLNPGASAGFKAQLAQAYVTRAWKALANADQDGAAADLRQAVQLDPTTSKTLSPVLRSAEGGRPGPYSAMARGFQHEADGNYDLAADDFSEAIRADAKSAQAYLSRAGTYKELGRLAQARADLDQAIKLDPKDWNGFYESGRLYEMMEQFDQARDSYRRASTLIRETHDAAFQDEKETIAVALKSVAFHTKLNARWISYLKEIQLSNNYPNWSAAPYDLYAARHNLPNAPPAPAVAPATASGKPSPTGSRFGKFVFPLLVLLGLLSIAWFIRYRRRQRAQQ